MGMWQDVVSSNIKRVRYDDASQEMEIQFNSNGAIYAYRNVPRDEFDGLVNAASAGSYYHDNIKGNYSDRRVG